MSAVVKTFAAKRIPTSGVLIRAKLPSQRLLPRWDPTNGWGDWFEGGVDVVDAPGDHFSLILDEKNLEAVGQRIRGVLDRRLSTKAKTRKLAVANERL